MPEATQAKPKQKRLTELSNFTVEFGGIYNTTPFLRSLRYTCRGQWKVSNFAQQKNGGRDLGPLFKMPDIPGEHAEIMFSQRCVRFFDPLENHPERLQKIQSVLQAANSFSVTSGKKLGPKRESRIDVNPDTMQTFIDELRRMIRRGRATVVDGEIPSEQVMDACEGRVLYDPGNRNPVKPKYRDEAPGWMEDLQKLTR